VLTDLAEFTHYVTRLKLAPHAAEHAAIAETERVRGAAFAAALSVRVLSRAWQMLVKGIQEVAQAPRPLAAAEMVLVRLCHAADLPTPDEAVRLVGEREGAANPPATPGRGGVSATAMPHGGRSLQVRQAEPSAAVESAERAPVLRRFADLIARAREERDLALVRALERHVRPVRFEAGRLEIALTPEAEPDLPQRLGQVLKDWTGERWMVVVSQAGAGQTVHETRQKKRAALFEDVRADPLVREVLDRFPGAEIVEVRERGEGLDDMAVAAVDSFEADAGADDED
jgi:DNA polymerase-3 subunit gamma/tau